MTEPMDDHDAPHFSPRTDHARCVCLCAGCVRITGVCACPGFPICGDPNVRYCHHEIGEGTTFERRVRERYRRTPERTEWLRDLIERLRTPQGAQR